MEQKLCAGIIIFFILTLQGCGQRESSQPFENTQGSTQSATEQASETFPADSQNTSEQISDNECISGTEQPATLIELDFTADINHNGVEDIIQFRGNGRLGSEITVSVMEEGNELYSTYMYYHVTLGDQYYLVNQNGKDYMMCYSPLVDHDMASCYYKVFSLDDNANVVVEASETMEISLYHVAEFDLSEWMAFAERENAYFADAILMISTSEGELVCGDAENPIHYTENFSWMRFQEEPSKSMEENLKRFIEDTMKEYGNSD